MSPNQDGRPEGCVCTFNQYMVGDGCHICNPKYWEDLMAEIETWPEVEDEPESPETLF